MQKSNISNIANQIKTQLPQYISSDEDYKIFVRFLELYYEWMSEESNPSERASKLESFADIDTTIDIFTSMFKDEMASVWPTIVRIKSNAETATERNQNRNKEGDAGTTVESISDQHWLTDGVSSVFDMDYFNPFYYFGGDYETVVTNIRVFINSNGSARGGFTTAADISEFLTSPAKDPLGDLGDYVELTENIDYTLSGNKLKFVDSIGNPDIYSINDLIKVRFRLATIAPAVGVDTSDVAVAQIASESKLKKGSYTNQANFLKYMKDFYQSKGSEDSYRFLFRALFNEPIEFYYPKNYTFKLSDNEWDTTTSVRTKPYVQNSPTSVPIESPYRITGQTSSATATVQSFEDNMLNSTAFREYYITNIVGEFLPKENITVEQQDGTSYSEELYNCVVGFDIINAGTNYPRNVALQNYFATNGSGSGQGFAAYIHHTTIGSIDNLEIVSGGDGYIVGEQIEFNADGLGGSGAVATVADVRGEEENYEVVFVQNPHAGEYPETIFEIDLATMDDDNKQDPNGTTPLPYPSNALNTLVSIENVDFLEDDVFYLHGFENFYDPTRKLLKDGTPYWGYYTNQAQKGSVTSLRYSSSDMSVSNPTPELINLNHNSVTETRYRADLKFTVSSVDADGAITNISITSAGENDTLSLPANSQSIFPLTVNLQKQPARLEGGRGFGLLFDIAWNKTDNTLSVTSNSNTASQLYVIGDTVKIRGSDLGALGVDGVNDIFVSVTGVSGGGPYTDINSTGYTVATKNGTGAVWDVDTQIPYTHKQAVLLSDLDGSTLSPTTGYAVGDVFKILGSDLGGTDASNTLFITVDSVDDEGRIILFTTSGIAVGGVIDTFTIQSGYVLPDVVKTVYGATLSGGSGFDAQVNVVQSGTTYDVRLPSRTDRGRNYIVGETLTILGTAFGGTSANDLTFVVSDVDASGGITGISSIVGTALNADQVTEVKPQNRVGIGALFDIDISLTTTCTVTVSGGNGGINYNVGDRLVIPGDQLSEQWIKDGFTSKLDQVGNIALYTNHGYLRTDDIDKQFAEHLTNDELTIDFWYFRKSTAITTLGDIESGLLSFNELLGGAQKTLLTQRPDGTIKLSKSDGTPSGGSATGRHANHLVSPVLSFGEWCHIAIYFSNGETSLYLNEKRVDTVNENLLEYVSGTSVYLGGRQGYSANFGVGNHTVGFFGSLRFTSGRRYEEYVSGSDTLITDDGTENPKSGGALSPIYVNPVPSVEYVRQSLPFVDNFIATDSQTTHYIDYDPDQVITIKINGVKAISGFTATSGTTITFSPALAENDTVKITAYATLSDNLEYIIYDTDAPASNRNKISLRIYDSVTSVYSNYQLPDGRALRVKWTAKLRSDITSTELVTGGYGYFRAPYGYVQTETLGYDSMGTGSQFIGHGKNIGAIDKIRINDAHLNSSLDGFGIGYDTAPTFDLTGIGDGQAIVNAVIGPLCVTSGDFRDQRSFASADNRITDSYLWQDYSYVIKVGRYIDEWRKIVKKVLHPAGLMMFGEYSVVTDAELRRGTEVWQQLIYEIIKNVNVKVRNMDGLGRWTYLSHDSLPQDTNFLNSTGLRITYDNRQETADGYRDGAGAVIGLYNGVGRGEVADDTVGSASVDRGTGRYALLGADDVDAYDWYDVQKIALNYSDASGKDYGYYYESEIIGNTVTIYDTSDATVTDDEWLNTQSWGKYRILAVTFWDSAIDRRVTFDVQFLGKYGNLPIDYGSPSYQPNKVEFRWDTVFRGNVDRLPNYWVGSIMDGANPRDEKMIINISGRFNNNKEGDVPTLHTTYRSLERFKFYFTDRYPWQRLSAALFSPVEEIYDSPYWKHRPLNNGNGLSYVPRKGSGYNIWYYLPIDESADSDWVANTDGTDHKWRNTRISEITEKTDRKYRAVLDSYINITPVYLVMSEETPKSNTRKRMGPTNLSVERFKFNEKLQLLDQNVDRIDYDENLMTDNTFMRYSDDGMLHQKTNFAPESSIMTYNTPPVTVTEINNNINSTLAD